MTYSLARATASEPLTIDGGVVRWAGSDPEPDAPLLRFEARLEDGEEIGDLVARVPMPAMLVAALAERFVDVSLDVGDPRWRRALAQARIARGEPVAAVDTPGEVVLDAEVVDACVLDGIVVALLRDALWIDGQTIPLPSTASYALLRPQLVDPDCVAVATFDRPAVGLMVFDVRRRALIDVASGEAPSSPLTFSRGTRGWWVHGDGGHACLGLDATIVAATATSTAWLPSRRQFIAWDSMNSVLRCVSLDDSEIGKVPCIWLGALAVLGDEVWFTSELGVFRWAGRGEAIQLAAGRMYGIAVDGDRVWVGTATRDLLALDHSGREVSRFPIKVEARAITVADTAILINTAFSRELVVDRTGATLASLSGASKKARLAMLRDGTCVVSGAESEIVTIDRDGVVRTALPLPYDHVVIGATDDRAIVAPALLWGTFVAYDAAGNLTSRLQPPAESVSGRSRVSLRMVATTREHVYLVETRGLVRWDPRGTPGGVAAPDQRVLHRGVHYPGRVTGPPGDFGIEDYGDIGIEIAGRDAFAVDCVFGGTTGENPEVPFCVSDGAIATFLRCDVSVGGAGYVVARAATAILVECRVPAGRSWLVGDACHLVLIDCTEVA